MISLTDLLLFLILVTMTTYTFMPWKGIDKGSKRVIAGQFILWAVIFVILIVFLNYFNILN